MSICGVYGIFNTVNGKVLVGSSNDIKRRWGNHRTTARGNYHMNPYFQKAWNKYGERSFEFRVLEECSTNALVPREDYWMAFHRSVNPEFGYNAKNASQSVVSDAVRAKQRAYHLGRAKSPEAVRKSADSHRGKRMSEATKARMSVAIKKRWDDGLMDNRKKPESNSSWFRPGSTVGAPYRFKPGSLAGKEFRFTCGHLTPDESRRKMSETQRKRWTDNPESFGDVFGNRARMSGAVRATGVKYPDDIRPMKNSPPTE